MTYEFPEIALIKTRDTVFTDKMQPHIEWELTRATVREVIRTQWSRNGVEQVRFMAFTFHLSRLPLYYTTYLIVPTICVTGLVIVVFHLPNIGGEKITLSISVLLGKSHA